MHASDTTFRSALRSKPGLSVAIAVGLLLAGLLAYAIWIINLGYTSPLEPLITAGILTLISASVVGVGITFAALQGSERWLRFGWLFLALGAASQVAVQVLKSYPLFLPLLRTTPEAIEIVALFYYPLTLLGLLFFSFVLVNRHERPILFLDLGITIIAMGLVLWYFMVVSSLSPLAQQPLKPFAFVDLLGDLLLWVWLITLVQREMPHYARWVLFFLILGMTARAIADSLFAYETFTQINLATPFLAILWSLAGWAEFTAGGLQVVSSRTRFMDTPPRFNPSMHMLRLALPYLAVITGLVLHALVLKSQFGSDPGQNITLYGLIGLIVIVGLRQYLLLWENVHLYQHMRRIAITDSLTGIYNRHFFNEMLPREIERAKRYQQSLSVMILDVDDFKKYNDTYGHLQADQVLKNLARLFATQLRTYDVLARFGGDEFVIILPETNRRYAQRVAERVRKAVATQVFARTTLNVSIGIASYRPGLSPEYLLDEADQDLYLHKANNKPQQAKPLYTPARASLSSLSKLISSNGEEKKGEKSEPTHM
jgi:diguanylate cyclase (GGDEF)-like protein